MGTALGPSRRDRDHLRLAYAWNAGQQVRYWREEPWEVDAVIEGTWGKWAIEVKTGDFTTGDLGGVLEFTRRFPSFPLVLGDETALGAATRADVEAVPWRRFLASGPPDRP